MGIESGLNQSNNQKKLLELRAQIKSAENNENEEKVLLLEAELRALEKGEIFDKDKFLLEKSNKEIELEKLNNRKHNILRKMQSIPNHEIWTYDGIEAIYNPRYSYEHTFRRFLTRLGVENFQQLVDKKSKELKRKIKVLDLFGGAYFIKNLENISNITGVRINDIDQELINKEEDYTESKNHLMSIINNKKRSIITGNLYKSETWKQIESRNKNKRKFDLIVCRPEGPFRNTDDKYYSIEGVSDTGTSREEIFVSILERTLKLLSDEHGVLFTQTPDLNTNPNTAKKFWEDYTEKKKLEGYEFIFNNNQKSPDESFVVIRNKIN